MPRPHDRLLGYPSVTARVQAARAEVVAAQVLLQNDPALKLDPGRAC